MPLSNNGYDTDPFNIDPGQQSIKGHLNSKHTLPLLHHAATALPPPADPSP